MTTQPSSAFTLITGGSGIGLELARQAAGDRRDLILAAQNPPALEAAAAELKRKVSVRVIPLDLSRPGAAEEVHDRVRALGAEVDCLINNAGFGDYGPFAACDLTRQERMISVNIAALTGLTRLFLPVLGVAHPGAARQRSHRHRVVPPAGEHAVRPRGPDRPGKLHGHREDHAGRGRSLRLPDDEAR